MTNLFIIPQVFFPITFKKLKIPKVRVFFLIIRDIRIQFLKIKIHQFIEPTDKNHLFYALTKTLSQYFGLYFISSFYKVKWFPFLVFMLGFT